MAPMAAMMGMSEGMKDRLSRVLSEFVAKFVEETVLPEDYLEAVFSDYVHGVRDLDHGPTFWFLVDKLGMDFELQL